MAAPTSPTNAYLTVAQTAQALNCSPDTVRRLISRGEMRATRFGRLIRIAVGDIARAGKPVTAACQSAAPSQDEGALSGRRPEESWAQWSERRSAAS